MKIYTGFGDKGNTRLFGGEVVTKDHLRIEVYGTLDELNSVLGMVISTIKNNLINDLLTRIQNDLFRISSILATPDEESRKKLDQAFKPDDIRFLENQIDIFDDQLEPLQNFILPGGTPGAAQMHLARTVCRRAERHLITLMKQEQIDSDIAVYMNRLSDLLFVAARFLNHTAGVPDAPWKKNG
jgi:cob(I)alamin adenosyltransferase